MGARILVADDSVTIQKVVELTFSKEDFQLVSARTGEEAIRKAREVRPDLMLIDLVMPDKSGYEVCETLRKDPLLKDVPIILLTGTFDAFDKNEGARVGVNDFVTKPFESQNLIGKVKQLLFARSIAAPPAAPRPPAAPPPVAPAPAAPAPLAPPPPLELWRRGPEVPPPLSPAAPKSAGSGGTELSEANLWDLLEREKPAAEPTYVLPEQTGLGLTLGPPVDEEEPTVLTTPAGDTDPTAGLTDMATGLSIPVELLPVETEATTAQRAEDVTMPLLENVEILPEEAPAPPAAAWPAAGAAAPVDVDRLTREITDRVARSLVQEVSDLLAGKIERIVWEVVPDLAEHLITQEIERIKGQAEGPPQKA